MSEIAGWFGVCSKCPRTIALGILERVEAFSNLLGMGWKRHKDGNWSCPDCKVNKGK